MRSLNDLVINVYSQFMLDEVKDFSDEKLCQSYFSSPLIKLLKIRIIELKIQERKMEWLKVFEHYYKKIYYEFTETSLLHKEEGINYHFLALSILHEYLEDSPAELIKFLTD